MAKKIQGIYKITNMKTNKSYIGKSVDIKHRWYQHKRNLNKNEHCNTHLQNAWNKYGESDFTFEIICETKSEEEINEKEIFYIDFYRTTKRSNGYNLSSGGEGGSVHDETKIKISLSQRGLGSSLSNDDVRQIKIAMYCLMDRKEIAEKFNVSLKVLTQISIGKSFNYICSELNDKIHNVKQQLTDERNNKFLYMYDNGITISNICKNTGYSDSIVEKCIYKYRVPHSDKKEKQIAKYYKVFKLHEEGVNDYQISKTLHISPSTVGRYLRGEQIPWNKAGNTKITDDISNKIYDMYFNKNMKSVEIGKMLDMANTTVMLEVNKYKFARESTQISTSAFIM